MLADSACRHLGAKPDASNCIAPPPIHGKCSAVIPGECQIGEVFDDNEQPLC